MTFPKIKRAKQDLMHPSFVHLIDLESERLSRAEWAKKLAIQLRIVFNHRADCQCHGCDVIAELLRQAEQDEKEAGTK